MSLSNIHCCYIVISTALKEKHTAEQDELSCCVIISSGLKESQSYVTKTKQCRKKCWSLSPPQGPWIPSSLRALDSLSIYQRISFLNI